MMIFGLNLSDRDLLLLSAAGALALVPIGVYVNNAITKRHNAAIEFRKAFDGVILNLRENPECPIAQFTYSFHNEHLAAITKYRQYVPFWRKRGYDLAVKEYKEAYNMAQDWGNIFAIVCSENTPIAREKREIYSKIIHNLLSFA